MLTFFYKHKFFYICSIFFLSINICFILVYKDVFFYLFVIINYIRSCIDFVNPISIKNAILFVSNYDILAQQSFVFVFFIRCYIYIPFFLFIRKPNIQFRFQKNSFIKYWFYIYFFFISIIYSFIFTSIDFVYTRFIDVLIPNEFYQKIFDVSNFLIIYKGCFFDFYYTYIVILIIYIILYIYPYQYAFIFFLKKRTIHHIFIRSCLYLFTFYFFFTYDNSYNLKILPYIFVSVECLYFVIRFFLIIHIFKIEEKILYTQFRYMFNSYTK